MYDNEILKEISFDEFFITYLETRSMSKSRIPIANDASLCKTGHPIMTWFAKNGITPNYNQRGLLIMDAIVSELSKLPYKDYVSKNGKYNGIELIKNSFDTSQPWIKGVITFVRFNTKKMLYPKAYEGIPYNPLVPIFLYAFKLYHDVPYSSWDYKSLDRLVHDDLYHAISPALDIPKYEQQEWIQIRQAYTTLKGEVKRPESYYPAFAPNVKRKEFDCLPKYTKIMLTQIWAAHPEHRSKFCILDPMNWDNIPESLEGDGDIFIPSEKSVSVNSLDW